jgi:hypothetical protein
LNHFSLAFIQPIAEISMFPNVLPKKVPQTLVYGVRQVLIQPQTEDVLSISRKSQLNTALPSLRDFVDEITGDSNVPHLTSAIHNVAQGIVQVIGVERLKDIAAASIPDTRTLPLDEEPPAYYGYMNPEEYFKETDPMIDIISSMEFEPKQSTKKKETMPTKKGKSTVQFEDITDKNEQLLKWKDWVESWTVHFRALINLIHRIVWGAKDSSTSLTESMNKEYEPEQKQILQLTFFGVFCVASYATELILIERCHSPDLRIPFRKTLSKLMAEFSSLQR